MVDECCISHTRKVNLLFQRIYLIPDKCVLTTGIAQVSDNINHLGFSGIIHPQIRGEGGPHSVACGLPAIRKNKSAIIAMLVADIALLLIMLIGLLRIRHSGGGRFDLGRLLWKQVRWSWIQ
jgi:hypothetical protein